MITLTNAENALKNVYLGTVTNLLNTKVNPLLAKIEQTQTDVYGNEIRTAAKIGLNGGISAGDEDGYLPAAGGNNYIQFVSTLKNLYGQIAISDKAIRASRDGRGAFTDLLNAELEGLLEAAKFNLGRMLYGDGSGFLSTFMPQTPDGLYYVTDVRNLMEGMLVDVYTSAGRDVAATRITYVDRVNSLIRFSVNPTADSGSLYVQGSKDKELTGLKSIFNVSSPLYGVDRQLNPALSPYVKNSAGAISETMIQQAIDSVETNANSKIDFIGVSADVKYAFQEYMAQYKRNIEMMDIEGGYKSMSFNGIPLVYDRFIENGTMYLLDTSAIKLHQLCDWRFLETENGNILRQAQDKPVYTATLVKYCDLICAKPNGQAKISGITNA